jgi:hypothetical protein
MNLDVKHLEFPHPSGAANSKGHKLMCKPATRENRICFWQQKVLAYLSQTADQAADDELEMIREEDQEIGQTTKLNFPI